MAFSIFSIYIYIYVYIIVTIDSFVEMGAPHSLIIIQPSLVDVILPICIPIHKYIYLYIGFVVVPRVCGIQSRKKPSESISHHSLFILFYSIVFIKFYLYHINIYIIIMKKAIIVGGSRGIGFAIARKFIVI